MKRRLDIERDQQRSGWGIDEYEHIDIPGGQGFSMEAGGCRTADGIVFQRSFVDELFEDVTDCLHDFFTSSSWRVS